MKVKLKKTLLKDYEKKTDILKAMAHPTRLFILDQLKKETLCVCEINELIDADVSTISKHLTVLKNAGLVSRTKKGLQVFYKLEAPCMLKSLECVESVINKK
jgi:ArsR family transcriptional regulator